MPVKITSPRAVNRRGDGELPDWQQNPIVHGCIRQCGRQQPRPDASHQRHHHDRRVKGEIGRQSGTDPLGKQHSEPQPRCHCRMRPTWACSRASTLFASPDPKRIGLPLACRTAGSRKCSSGATRPPACHPCARVSPSLPAPAGPCCAPCPRIDRLHLTLLPRNTCAQRGRHLEQCRESPLLVRDQVPGWPPPARAHFLVGRSASGYINSRNSTRVRGPSIAKFTGGSAEVTTSSSTTRAHVCAALRPACQGVLAWGHGIWLVWWSWAWEMAPQRTGRSPALARKHQGWDVPTYTLTIRARSIFPRPPSHALGY